MKPEIVSWFGNTWGKGFFERKGKQTTNWASVNITTLASLPVPVIPAAEQEVILEGVNRRLSVVDELGSMLDSSLRRAARLRRAILEKAFRGELVPQDPNDEPAAILLERIRVERAAEVKPKTARPQKPRAQQVPAK